MPANQDRDYQPSNVAVRCGRLTFYLVGGIVVAVPLVLAAGGIVIGHWVEWLVAGSGIVLILLGALLPPRVVARCGFDLPSSLPNLPDLPDDD